MKPVVWPLSTFELVEHYWAIGESPEFVAEQLGIDMQTVLAVYKDMDDKFEKWCLNAGEHRC
jgi:hypothetical protein